MITAGTARQGYDNGVACHAFLGRVLWHLGFPDQGLVHAEAAIAASRAVAHPFRRSLRARLGRGALPVAR